MTAECKAALRTADPSATQDVSDDGYVSVTIYDGVPSDVGAEMDALYQNLYASSAQFRLTCNVAALKLYVARKDKQPLAILAFEIRNRVAHVINSVIRLDRTEIWRFTREVFARLPQVSAVSFRAIQTDVEHLPLPFQHFRYSEDIVVSLPDTVNAYLDALGKSTKKNVKYYGNKLKRNFPTFDYRVYRKEEITEQLVREIVQLKKTRMADKNKTMHSDDGEVGRIMRMAKVHGLVGAATINGKVCAGSIGYLIGSHAFGAVLAHDPQYDSYWIGMLCCYMTISACIEMGCTEYHFQWGQDDYKFRLLGVQRDLDNLVIYRSRLHMLLNAGTALNTETAGRIRLMKRWLTDPKNRDKALVKIATRAVRLVKGGQPGKEEKTSTATDEEHADGQPAMAAQKAS